MPFQRLQLLVADRNCNEVALVLLINTINCWCCNDNCCSPYVAILLSLSLYIYFCVVVMQTQYLHAAVSEVNKLLTLTLPSMSIWYSVADLRSCVLNCKREDVADGGCFQGSERWTWWKSLGKILLFSFKERRGRNYLVQMRTSEL